MWSTFKFYLIGGVLNPLNLKMLVLYFVPRNLEWQHTWDLKWWRRDCTVCRHSHSEGESLDEGEKRDSEKRAYSLLNHWWAILRLGYARRRPGWNTSSVEEWPFEVPAPPFAVPCALPFEIPGEGTIPLTEGLESPESPDQLISHSLLCLVLSCLTLSNNLFWFFYHCLNLALDRASMSLTYKAKTCNLSHLHLLVLDIARFCHQLTDRVYVRKRRKYF